GEQARTGEGRGGEARTAEARGREADTGEGRRGGCRRPLLGAGRRIRRQRERGESRVAAARAWLHHLREGRDRGRREALSRARGTRERAPARGGAGGEAQGREAADLDPRREQGLASRTELAFSGRDSLTASQKASEGHQVGERGRTVASATATAPRGRDLECSPRFCRCTGS